MSIFDFDSYYEYLKTYIESQPKKGWGVVSKIAEAIDMTQAHVSQVLSGKKNFTLEQGYKLCKHLKMTELESDFLVNLIQRERAGTKDLQDYFDLKISALKRQALKMKNHVEGYRPMSEQEMGVFYSSWLYSAIRIFSSLHDGKTLKEISDKFNLPAIEAEKILKFLVDHGLCILQNNRYLIGSQRTLVEKGSPHNLNHTTNWRLRAIENSRMNLEPDIFLSSPMSLSIKDYEKLRNEILAFMKKTSEIVADSPAETAVCFNIDLFKI